MFVLGIFPFFTSENYSLYQLLNYQYILQCFFYFWCGLCIQGRIVDPIEFLVAPPMLRVNSEFVSFKIYTNCELTDSSLWQIELNHELLIVVIFWEIFSAIQYRIPRPLLELFILRRISVIEFFKIPCCMSVVRL